MLNGVTTFSTTFDGKVIKRYKKMYEKQTAVKRITVVFREVMKTYVRDSKNVPDNETVGGINGIK